MDVGMFARAGNATVIGVFVGERLGSIHNLFISTAHFFKANNLLFGYFKFVLIIY